MVKEELRKILITTKGWKKLEKTEGNDEKEENKSTSTDHI